MSHSSRRTAAIAAAFSATMLVGAIGLRVGHDEPRLVRTAGVTAPLEESSTTSTSLAPAPAPETAAEIDATLENHETRIGRLESTTTTAAPAAQPAPTAAVPAPVAEPTTTTSTTPAAVEPAPPTTTTTFYGEPWWCTVPGAGRSYKVPCDSTTTTTAPVG